MEGVERFHAGDWPAVIEKMNQAIKEFEEEGDAYMLAAALGNLGSGYANTSRVDKALEAWDRSLGYYERLINISWKPELGAQMANILIMKASRIGNDPTRIKEAVELYDKAIEVLDRVIYQDGDRSASESLKDACEFKGDLCLKSQPEIAADAFTRAIRVTKKIENTARQIDPDEELGILYIKRAQANLLLNRDADASGDLDSGVSSLKSASSRGVDVSRLMGIADKLRQQIR